MQIMIIKFVDYHIFIPILRINFFFILTNFVNTYSIMFTSTGPKWRYAGPLAAVLWSNTGTWSSPSTVFAFLNSCKSNILQPGLCIFGKTTAHKAMPFNASMSSVYKFKNELPWKSNWNKILRTNNNINHIYVLWS